MKRWILLAIVLVVTACTDIETNRVEVGRPAPEYGALTLQGDSVRLADLRGEVVLLNVWATWCAPCREEIPALQELYEQYSGDGFAVVGVSIDARGQGESIRRFVDDFGVTYPIWHDPDDIVGTRYRIIGVPSTFLIDREGIVRWSHVGPVRADDPALTAVLNEALAGT